MSLMTRVADPATQLSPIEVDTNNIELEKPEVNPLGAFERAARKGAYGFFVDRETNRLDCAAEFAKEMQEELDLIEEPSFNAIAQSQEFNAAFERACRPPAEKIKTAKRLLDIVCGKGLLEVEESTTHSIPENIYQAVARELNLIPTP